MTSLQPGVISVSGDFIANSTAIGMLVIVYSYQNETDIHYAEARLSSESQQAVVTFKGLSGNTYQVSGFVMDESGLPFNRAANSSTIIHIDEGSYILCED